MTDDDYEPVKLPKDLLGEVDALVGKHGYKSRAEVVKDACRRLIRAYNKLEE